ncbi:MAG: phage tail protein [Hymenobacter sp.]|nr:MAG: phage tail protein [Hymenobacter sp.]
MDPFVGEIRAFGFNFAPRAWAPCQGQLLSIAQNTALFSLLGTTYGGNGQTTFGLPDLRGRLIVNPGTGAGLSTYNIGQLGGIENETLQLTELPAHIHTLGAGLTVTTSSAAGTSSTPAGNVLAVLNTVQHYSTSPDAQMAAGSIAGTATAVGSGTPHSNLMPYLCINYCISLTGIFPQRP